VPPGSLVPRCAAKVVRQLSDKEPGRAAHWAEKYSSLAGPRDARIEASGVRMPVGASLIRGDESPAKHERRSAWLEEHRGIFVKVARSFARGENDVGELQQEMMSSLWLSLPALCGQGSLRRGSTGCALNTALTWRRGAQRRNAALSR